MRAEVAWCRAENNDALSRARKNDEEMRKRREATSWRDRRLNGTAQRLTDNNQINNQYNG